DLGDADHPDRYIRIDPPELLEFVPQRGIRVETGAQLQWTVAGVALPFTIHSARLLLAPVAVEGRFKLIVTLEEADLKNVPKLIDRSIVSHINARLAEKRDSISWNFIQTLTLRLALPATMSPLERFEMDATEAAVAIDDNALQVSLTLP